KPVVETCFLIGAISIALLTLKVPIGVLLAVVAIVGLGTSRTQTLIYGFVLNYHRTNGRGARVAWRADLGRLVAAGGPLLRGCVMGAGVAIDAIFYVLAGIGVLGVLLTLLVPAARGSLELHSTAIEPTLKAAPSRMVARPARTT